MSENAFAAMHGLNRPDVADGEWNGFVLREVTDENLYWLSVHSSGVASFSDCCRKVCGAELPAPGKFTSTEIAGRSAVLAWCGRDQWFLQGADLERPAALEKCCSIVAQSDGWVGFAVAGVRTRDILARVCSLDLHPSVFRSGDCARTAFETLSGHILCIDASEPSYRLLTPRSSARSFLDGLCHAANRLC